MKNQPSLGPLPSCFFTLLLHISHTQLAATPRAKSFAILPFSPGKLVQNGQKAEGDGDDGSRSRVCINLCA